MKGLTMSLWTVLYLVSASVFYAWIAKCAPLEAEEVACEVIELYPSQRDQAASRAA